MAQTHSIPVSSWRAWQTPMNEHWPAKPRDTQLPQPGIPVVARVVWSRDGETLPEGQAIRWTSSEVFVSIRDPRCAILGVWLLASDVRRI